MAPDWKEEVKIEPKFDSNRDMFEAIKTEFKPVCDGHLVTLA